MNSLQIPFNDVYSFRINRPLMSITEVIYFVLYDLNS